MEEVTIQDLLSGKVHLEFGNKGQLTAIRLYEKMKEDAMKRCGICNGDGVVTCEACDGTGEKKS